MIIGIVLSLGIVFVIFYFDTTIKSAEEVENKLGLPIYGIVPKINKKENSRWKDERNRIINQRKSQLNV